MEVGVGATGGGLVVVEVRHCAGSLISPGPQAGRQGCCGPPSRRRACSPRRLRHFEYIAMHGPSAQIVQSVNSPAAWYLWRAPVVDSRPIRTIVALAGRHTHNASIFYYYCSRPISTTRDVVGDGGSACKPTGFAPCGDPEEPSHQTPILDSSRCTARHAQTAASTFEENFLSRLPRAQAERRADHIPPRVPWPPGNCRHSQWSPSQLR